MESEAAVGRWTSLIVRKFPKSLFTNSEYLTCERKRKWGFCFVDNCPPTGPATQQLIERIALIRNTHYGKSHPLSPPPIRPHKNTHLHQVNVPQGGFWHVTPNLSVKDAAYTSLPLSAHTDTTYFSDPAGLQTFHVLSHTHGSGGASLLVDGFRAARILRLESPDAFHALCTVKINAHSSGNEGICIVPSGRFPVFVTKETSSSSPDVPAEVVQIRWNNEDRASLPADRPEDVAKFYAAARKWVEILRRLESEYWVQLKPGRVLSKFACRTDVTNGWAYVQFFAAFDNWRILHGRSAFTGDREMCGGYSGFLSLSRFSLTIFSMPV